MYTANASTFRAFLRVGESQIFTLCGNSQGEHCRLTTCLTRSVRKGGRGRGTVRIPVGHRSVPGVRGLPSGITYLLLQMLSFLFPVVDTVTRQLQGKPSQQVC